ncbi:MAG: hypothetical protein FJZ47_20285 [Candidatus Tectomicrobia bacterium]|uniref:Uncharacterized protein n=1 Tax=Tectimicrobiota bacterium TaxID=2528274 RepID=A0A937W383_UNCTE|nr:hypothetical protein [Candidatus Tectomicrobia bacterium]
MHFRLYAERPWVHDVLKPFATYHALHLLSNADVFVRLNSQWTKTVLEMAAAQAPVWVLQELRKLVAIDARWAQQLATTAATAAPQAVLSHVEVLLSINAEWAQGLLRQAIYLSPQAAARALSRDLTSTRRQELFVAAVLTDPRWIAGLSLSAQASDQALLATLEHVKAPPIQTLRQVIQSNYPEETKARMAVFVWDIAQGQLTLEEAAHLSSHTHTYLHALVSRKLADQHGVAAAIETALQEETLTLIELLNSLFDRPDAVRFQAVAGLAARELYMLITYGDAEIFTSSYRGLFERLLARMRQEGLTGDQLLAQVRELHLRVFMKSAAVFNTLQAFLATVPAPVARWTLLTQCVSDLARPQDLPAQAMLAAELLAAPLDTQSLHLLRDTLKVEYARAAQEQHRPAMVIYGLLIAQLVQRQEAGLTDTALLAMAAPYRSALPDRTRIPLERLFADGTGVQWHFFYNDDDGQQSFHSFVAQYQRSSAWQIEQHGTFIRIVSQPPGRRIEIYANLFTEDIQGPSDIEDVFRARRLSPGVIVHRGHSPYVERTLAKVPATTALVFLGNCGGFTLLDAVLSKAPDTHLITTKGIGSITVNDPLLKALNDSLLRGTDLSWSSFWKQITPQLVRNPRFADYVPPDKNAGIIFLRAYRSLLGETRSLP